jgi:hypothetical protein
MPPTAEAPPVDALGENEIYEDERNAIRFVAIDFRDGEQMPTALPSVDKDNLPADVYEANLAERTRLRIDIFDRMIDAGFQHMEIGHLGNEVDAHFAQHLIPHVNAKAEEDERYVTVKMQVLFGTREGEVEQGVAALAGFDQDRVVVHVYDREHDGLLNLAETPYSADESAQHIKDSAQVAYDHGFRHFSVSGEGATAVGVDEAIDFYSDIGQFLRAMGAETINLNVANTYGISPVGSWNPLGMSRFNREVKENVPDATTSIHVHNDGKSATEVTMSAIRVGFDIVEGTLFGMGERTGNVAICDVIYRLLEDAREQIKEHERGKTVEGVGVFAVDWSRRYIERSVAEVSHRMFQTCVEVAEIYGTQSRFAKTILADEDAFVNGSGPHDHAARRALEDPVRWPLYETYARSALALAALGRPEAIAVIEARPDIIRKNTVNGHAGSRNTASIMDGKFIPATDDRRAEALAIARGKIDQMFAMAA